MIKHLIALTPENWITIAGIAATVILAVIGGIFTWYRWIKDRTPKITTETDSQTPPPPTPPGTIHNLPYRTIGNLLEHRAKPCADGKIILTACNVSILEKNDSAVIKKCIFYGWNWYNEMS